MGHNVHGINPYGVLINLLDHLHAGDSPPWYTSFDDNKNHCVMFSRVVILRTKQKIGQAGKSVFSARFSALKPHEKLRAKEMELEHPVYTI